MSLESELRVGFVTIWFERGQSYVTKAIRDALAPRHETFVFARTGIVHETGKLETTGQWDVPNLTTHPSYDIDVPSLVRWARENRIHVVVFNEEYDWNLVRAMKAEGLLVVTYLDFFHPTWRPLLSIYDGILCSTRRTYEMVRDAGPAEFVGWGVDTDTFRPLSDTAPRATFFHNAGWLGINYRKMTPALLLAFDHVARIVPGVTLLIHAQVGPEKLPPSAQRILETNRRVIYHVETVPPPGLYGRGEILVFPSKLEGLGLPLPEGLACGLPAIATDAAPMNEFVQDGRNGLLVRVGERVDRHDGIAFPETLVDVGDLVAKMAELASDLPRARRMGEAARAIAERTLARENFADRIERVFDRLAGRPPGPVAAEQRVP